MAKLIKFALSIGNLQIYTLEELRENFFIDDVLVLYRQGRLQRWLKCRGYHKQLEQLKGLYSLEDKELITAFSKIFEVGVEDYGVDILTQSINFVGNAQEAKNNDFKLDLMVNNVVKTHYRQYQNLIADIKSNHLSLIKIRGILQTISEKYIELLSLDVIGFVYSVKDSAPLALIGMLMNNKIRALYEAPVGKPSKAVNKYRVFKPEEPWQIINQVVASYPSDLQLGLWEYHLKEDRDEWVNLRRKNVRCMVVFCVGKCLIQAAEPSRAVILDKAAVNGRYPILLGLDFKGQKDALVRYVVF